jgi:uncharacterized protein YndB with AHSA1/START domain
MLKNDPPIITQESFNKPISEVWKAITNCEQMKEWFFYNIPNFEAKIGFKTKFNVKSENRDFLHLWKVIDLVPNKKITTNWKYQNIKGDSNVTFGLNEDQKGTTLTVTCEILEDFPQNIPEFKTESCQAGWNYFIKDRLKNYLTLL